MTTNWKLPAEKQENIILYESCYADGTYSDDSVNFVGTFTVKTVNGEQVDLTIRRRLPLGAGRDAATLEMREAAKRARW